MNNHEFYVQLARETLAHVKAGLCPHGVKWVDCRQHDTDVVAGEVIQPEESTDA